MTQMVDRNPAGRDADEGFEAAVEDRDVKQLLMELLIELKRLRLAYVISNGLDDIGDLDDLMRFKP